MRQLTSVLLILIVPSLIFSTMNNDNGTITCSVSYGNEPPPRDLYDINWVTDPSTLNYTMERIEITSDDVEIYQVTYFSGTWEGIHRDDWVAWEESGFQGSPPDTRKIDWVIQGYLCLPPDLDPARKYGVITQLTSANTDPGLDFQREYGEVTSLLFGVPVFLISTPPQTVIHQLGYTDENDLAGYSRLWVFQIGDLKMSATYAMALSYMRAVTFLDGIAGEKAFDLSDGVVILGSSKRGISVWTAAAVDIRIKGIVSCACDWLNVEAGLQRVIDDWYDDEEAVTKAEQLQSLIKTLNGQSFIAHYDPYTVFHNTSLPETFKAMMIAGTNDAMYPIRSLGDFIEGSSFEEEKTWTYVPNYTHGCGSMKHVANLRAWVAHVFEGRKVTQVTHTLFLDEWSMLHASANVSTLNNVETVNLIYAVKSTGDKDFRETQWFSKTMTQEESGVYTTKVSLPNNIKWVAAYVEVEDRDPVLGLPAYTSSLLEIISPAIKIIKPENAIYAGNKKVLTFPQPLIFGRITVGVELLDSTFQVDTVEFFIDDECKAVDTLPPFEWTWDEFAIGKHMISVKSYDTTGTMAGDQVSVIIFNMKI